MQLLRIDGRIADRRTRDRARHKLLKRVHDHIGAVKRYQQQADKNQLACMPRKTIKNGECKLYETAGKFRCRLFERLLFLGHSIQTSAFYIANDVPQSVCNDCIQLMQ